MAVNDVPSPSAAIATSSPQVDASTSSGLMRAKAGASGGMKGATLLSTHNATNTSANTGTGTWATVVATVRRANIQPTARTTGSISSTRNSLTTTAVLPVASDTAYPAPTTCATSWMVAPSITPVVRGSKPSAMQTSG